MRDDEDDKWRDDEEKLSKKNTSEILSSQYARKKMAQLIKQIEKSSFSCSH